MAFTFVASSFTLLAVLVLLPPSAKSAGNAPCPTNYEYRHGSDGYCYRKIDGLNGVNVILRVCYFDVVTVRSGMLIDEPNLRTYVQVQYFNA